MQSLGELMAKAGVRGAKKDFPPVTIAELRAASASTQEPEPVYCPEAMENLSPEFQSLMAINKGERFVEQLQWLLSPHHHPVLEVTRHTIYGLAQVVHYHRDRLSGSKRKSFDRLIPGFLRMKKRLEGNNQPTDLRRLILDNL